MRNWRGSIVAGVLALAALTWTTTTEAQVGDTIYFRADVLDSEGDTVTGAVIRWASEDSTALRIEELPNGRARGVALRKGTVRVWVTVEPFTSLETAVLLPGGILDWGRHIEFTALGQSVQLCAYLHRRGELVAEAPGPPTCPVVFVAPATPAFWPTPYIDRRMIWDRLMVYATQVR